MSDIPFERYDAEFISLTEQVQSSIGRLDGTKPGGGGGGGSPKSPESDIRYCSGLLSQCDELLKQMQIEARSVDDASAKRDLLQKVRTCKARLANLRDDYNSAKTAVERQSLLGDEGDLENGRGRGKSGRGVSSDHKERLLRTNEQIGKQNETLEHARRVMADTEETAMEITSELGRNREKIQSAHNRVRDVSGLTNQARRIVQSMSRREVQQKLMMYCVAFLLVLAIIVILYVMGR